MTIHRRETSAREYRQSSATAPPFRRNGQYEGQQPVVKRRILTADIRVTSCEPHFFYASKESYLSPPQSSTFRRESSGFASNIVPLSCGSVALHLRQPPDSHPPRCQFWPRLLYISFLWAGLKNRCVRAASVLRVLPSRLFVGTFTVKHIGLEFGSTLK